MYTRRDAVELAATSCPVERLDIAGPCKSGTSPVVAAARRVGWDGALAETAQHALMPHFPEV